MIIGIEAQRLFRRKKHGMEIVALEVIKELQKLDTTNHYTIFAKAGEDEECITPNSNFAVNKLSNSPYPVWEQIALPNAIKKLRPDILHCTANTAPLLCNVPLVITIHDIIYLESVSFSGSSYQNFGNLYRRFIVPKISKNGAIIITVSEYEKEIIAKRLNISKEKIRVVYNGINKQFKVIDDTAKLSEFSQKYNLPAKFILHFANTAPKKNTIGVLKAHKIYTASTPNVLPLVLTDCDRIYIEQLLKEIDAIDLINNILILSYIPFAQIPLLYNLAEILLYPSHRESFGMPVIEAMACGTPVITSNTSALPEIAGGAACLVEPTNADEIAQAVIRLNSDQNFYKAQQELGFINAAKFNWEIAAKQTLAIYNEIKNSK